jgi:hypothetical protein
MLELRGALPEARLQAYPVATFAVRVRAWWRTGRGARLLVVEYMKYLAILGRETVLRMGPRSDAPKASQTPSPQEAHP